MFTHAELNLGTATAKYKCIFCTFELATELCIRQSLLCQALLYHVSYSISTGGKVDYSFHKFSNVYNNLKIADYKLTIRCSSKVQYLLGFTPLNISPFPHVTCFSPTYIPSFCL